MNNRRCLSCLACLVFLGTAFTVCAAYRAPESFTHPATVIQLGCAKYATDQADDSAVFQRAIDDVAAQGGGHVIVPAGAYQLNGISLKSEAHLIFEKGVELRLSPDKRGRTGGWFFQGGRDDLYTENVSITARDQWVDVYLPRKTKSARLAVFSDIDNFHVSGFMIHDQRTTHSSLIFVWAGEDNGRSQLPKNGLVENIWAKNAHYGYGALQVHAGNDLHFRNILAVGGVAARLETGLPKMNLAAWGKEPGYIGLNNITLEDITSLNGQAALMSEPHTIRHGSFVAKDIKADGSEFAVSICSGFVSKGKYFESGQTQVDPTELSAGNFESIKVDNIQANYRADDIVTRYAHFRYYAEEEHPNITQIDHSDFHEPCSRGPAIVAVYNGQSDDPKTSITNLKAFGYPFHPDIITKKDLYQGSLRPLTKQTKIKNAPDLPWAGVDVQFEAPLIKRTGAWVRKKYSGSIASTAQRSGANKVVFTKLFGPDWLTVEPDGSLRGTPAKSGVQYFTIKASNAAGFDVAQLEIHVSR